MKVGTDGVLLGAWAGVRPSDRRILDVGTGTGLIALMMAQRAPEARITGVDVEKVLRPAKTPPRRRGAAGWRSNSVPCRNSRRTNAST